MQAPPTILQMKRAHLRDLMEKLLTAAATYNDLYRAIYLIRRLEADLSWQARSRIAGTQDNVVFVNFR